METLQKRYGIGIVGGGNWAKWYVPAIRNSEFLDLKGVAVGYNVEEFAKTHEMHHYPDYNDMLNDQSIDIVCIILQHQLHHEYAIKAMEHGKHVLVEKPMAVTVEQCDEMIACAEKNNVKIQVAHSRRFTPIIRKAKQILDSGELGKIHMIQSHFVHPVRPPYEVDGELLWKVDPERGQSFFLGYGCHHIDYLHYLVESRCESLFARMDKYWTDVDTVNAGMILMNFENGAYASFWELDTVAPEIKEWPPFPGFQEKNEIVCENGLMVVEPYSRLLIRKNGDWETIFDLPYEEADPIHQFLREEVETLAVAADTDTDPPCPGEDGRHTVEIILAALESSKMKKSVELRTSPKFDKQCDPLHYD
ncbi:MAG: Gfo/Idh/MocA family oxidoreductase [Bacteroidota bacterium]